MSGPVQPGDKNSPGRNPPYTVLDAITTSASVLLENNVGGLSGAGVGVTDKPAWQMSMAVIILIIVASLSVVVGAIYLLIYFKSIKPMSARSRSYTDQGGKTDDEGGRSKSAHPFFRRK